MPIEQARLAGEGLHVPYDKASNKDAPPRSAPAGTCPKSKKPSCPDVTVNAQPTTQRGPTCAQGGTTWTCVR